MVEIINSQETLKKKPDLHNSKDTYHNIYSTYNLISLVQKLFNKSLFS